MSTKLNELSLDIPKEKKNDYRRYPISTLLDIEQRVIYTIPRYQREYTWNRAQWDALLDDLLENEPQYFLGSIICINQSKDALDVQSL